MDLSKLIDHDSPVCIITQKNVGGFHYTVYIIVNRDDEVTNDWVEWKRRQILHIMKKRDCGFKGRIVIVDAAKIRDKK